MIGIPFRTYYCSSKYAVNGFFNALHMEVGKDIAITQFNPTTVTGTSFRANGLGNDGAVREAAKSEGDNFLTVENCAELCVVAADREIRNFVVPHLQYWLTIASPLVPAITEP